jgi:hypothetical protein
MKLRNTFLSIFLFLSVSTIVFGQSDDLRIFGYFQNTYTRMDVKLDGMAPAWIENSFDMQQLNIFFAKNFGSELSSFVNLEFTNSFNLQDTIGGFDIQEAWLKYSPSSAFNLKAGLMIPKFNYMNEIKNKTALLPYIYRPLVYETMFSSQFSTSDFVPQQAYLQVYGDLSVGGDSRVNYALYMGKLDENNLNTNRIGLSIGHDSSHYKMVGGRLGFESGNLVCGVSGTYDRKNLWAYGIGYVPRMRFGAYLNYALAGFEFESEYIRVYNKLTSEDYATLAAYDMTNFFGPKGFNKYYYHVNLLYNFTDKIYAYAGYDYLTTEDNIFSEGGLTQPLFGGGYRVNDSIVLKAEYTHQGSTLFGVLKAERNDYLLGASVAF